jgi:hypothetical protein
MVLEQMAAMVMTQVECDSMACQQSPHEMAKLALQWT